MRGLRVVVLLRVLPLVNGDVKVDFFTHNLARSKVASMDAIGSLLVGLFGALIAWRTAAGALAASRCGETSTILGWPLWIPQALMVPGFVLLAAAGFYMCLLHLRAALRERGRRRTAHDRHRRRLRHLRRDAGADGRARAHRHRDVHRRRRGLRLPDGLQRAARCSIR